MTILVLPQIRTNFVRRIERAAEGNPLLQSAITAIKSAAIGTAVGACTGYPQGAAIGFLAGITLGYGSVAIRALANLCR